MPSVEWLLEQYAEDFGLPSASFWWGPQDSKSLLFTRAGLDYSDLPDFIPRLERFAQFAYEIEDGERRPAAGIARVVHEAATSALRLLDLCCAYTRGDPPSLSFDPSRTRIVIDKSNKTGRPRSTVVLRLDARTVDAAAFLYGSGGYNFVKLEQMLEGILIGMGSHRSIWLSSVRVPSRLRLDVHLPESIVDQLPGFLKAGSAVNRLRLEDALALGVLDTTSGIYKRLSSEDLQNSAHLLVYCGSETIGPSIQYSMVVSALALELGLLK